MWPEEFSVSLSEADLRNLEDSVDFEYNRSKTDDELCDNAWVGGGAISFDLIQC